MPTAVVARPVSAWLLALCGGCNVSRLHCLPENEHHSYMPQNRKQLLALIRDCTAWPVVLCSDLQALGLHGPGWVCTGPVSCTEMPAGAANRSMRAAVKAFADAGGVVYAECGGLLYLSQSLQPLNELPCSMGAPDQRTEPGGVHSGLCNSLPSGCEGSACLTAGSEAALSGA